VVEDREALWIAKFNRRDDKWNQARVEHAMLTLARECGLSVSQSRLTQIADRDALLVNASSCRALRQPVSLPTWRQPCGKGGMRWPAERA